MTEHGDREGQDHVRCPRARGGEAGMQRKAHTPGTTHVLTSCTPPGGGELGAKLPSQGQHLQDIHASFGPRATTVCCVFLISLCVTKKKRTTDGNGRWVLWMTRPKKEPAIRSKTFWCLPLSPLSIQTPEARIVRYNAQTKSFQIALGISAHRHLRKIYPGSLRGA